MLESTHHSLRGLPSEKQPGTFILHTPKVIPSDNLNVHKGVSARTSQGSTDENSQSYAFEVLALPGRENNIISRFHEVPQTIKSNKGKRLNETCLITALKDRSALPDTPLARSQAETPSVETFIHANTRSKTTEDNKEAMRDGVQMLDHSSYLVTPDLSIQKLPNETRNSLRSETENPKVSGANFKTIQSALPLEAYSATTTRMSSRQQGLPQIYESKCTDSTMTNREITRAFEGSEKVVRASQPSRLIDKSPREALTDSQPNSARSEMLMSIAQTTEVLAQNQLSTRVNEPKINRFIELKSSTPWQQPNKPVNEAVAEEHTLQSGLSTRIDAANTEANNSTHTPELTNEQVHYLQQSQNNLIALGHQSSEQTRRAPGEHRVTEDLDRLKQFPSNVLNTNSDIIQDTEQESVLRSGNTSRDAGSLRGVAQNQETIQQDPMVKERILAPIETEQSLRVGLNARHQNRGQKGTPPVKHTRDTPLMHPVEAVAWQTTDISKEIRPEPTRTQNDGTENSQRMVSTLEDSTTIASITGKHTVLIDMLKVSEQHSVPMNSRLMNGLGHSDRGRELFIQDVRLPSDTQDVSIEAYLTRIKKDNEPKKITTEKMVRDFLIGNREVNTENWVRGGTDTRSSYKVPATYIRS